MSNPAEDSPEGVRSAVMRVFCFQTRFKILEGDVKYHSAAAAHYQQYCCVTFSPFSPPNQL